MVINYFFLLSEFSGLFYLTAGINIAFFLVFLFLLPETKNSGKQNHKKLFQKPLGCGVLVGRQHTRHWITLCHYGNEMDMFSFSLYLENMCWFGLHLPSLKTDLIFSPCVTTLAYKVMQFKDFQSEVYQSQLDSKNRGVYPSSGRWSSHTWFD